MGTIKKKKKKQLLRLLSSGGQGSWEPKPTLKMSRLYHETLMEVTVLHFPSTYTKPPNCETLEAPNRGDTCI